MTACFIGRHVLGYEVFWSAGYAVVIRPAINYRQLWAPIAMRRRRIGSLPLERCGPPRVAAGFGAVKVARDHVVEEYHLGRADDERCNGDEGIQAMCRIRNECGVAILVV